MVDVEFIECNETYVHVIIESCDYKLVLFGDGQEKRFLNGEPHEDEQAFDFMFEDFIDGKWDTIEVKYMSEYEAALFGLI